jgi:hypothetical protein
MGEAVKEEPEVWGEAPNSTSGFQNLVGDPRGMVPMVLVNVGEYQDQCNKYKQKITETVVRFL